MGHPVKQKGTTAMINLFVVHQTDEGRRVQNTSSRKGIWSPPKSVRIAPTFDPLADRNPANAVQPTAKSAKTTDPQFAPSGWKITQPCQECESKSGPSHNASKACESGGRNHCSCEACF